MSLPQYKAENIWLDYSYKISETEYKVYVKTSGFLPANYRSAFKTEEGNPVIMDDFYVHFTSTIDKLNQNIARVKGYIDSANGKFHSENPDRDLLQSAYQGYHDQNGKEELIEINKNWANINPAIPSN